MKREKIWYHTYSSGRLLWLSYLGLPFYVGLVGLGVTLLLAVWNYKMQLLRPGIVRWLGLVALWMVGQTLLAHDPVKAGFGLVHYLPYFGLFAVLLVLEFSVADWRGLAWGLLLASVPVNVAGLVEYILKAPGVEAILADQTLVNWMYQGEHYHRAASIFSNPNVYANYLVVLLGLGLGLVGQWPQRWRQISLVIALGLVGIGIVCSGSRNGWLVALSQLMLMLWLGRLRGRLHWLGRIGVLALVGSGILGGIGTYELTLADINQSLQHDSRLNTWWVAWQLVQAKPWLGWGLGSFAQLYPTLNPLKDYLQMSHAHNIGLMLLVEGGLVLTLALALPVGYVCYRGVRSLLLPLFQGRARATLLGYGLALWGLLGFSLFDLPFYDARINALHWMVLAGVYGLTGKDEASTSG
ncbi:hypothetical protein D0962_12540 [Leptolyngbyaceae cyanobacterium CCMR0082]|uniref:O-antigen ligase-related domain-containing protein n=1 Tax=Adonisia turfae CCMR0082 TaxID=2304604 RepID=A0A6M0S5G8_9CYAN|nr:O-antigen ligase family protein [Adonisia turfae]NEZ63600.1 hypothetical protein [Adonisia turfae CCMR0082]